MKKNIAFAFLSTLFAVPVLSMAQEQAPAAETAAEKSETTAEVVSEAVADAAEAVAETAADAAEAVADAAVETAEAVANNLISVFDRASQRDAWDLRLSVFAYYGDNRDSIPDSYTEEQAEKYRYSAKEEDIRYGIQPSATFSGHFAGNQHYKLGYSPIFQYWANPRVGDKRTEFSHVAMAEYRYVLDTRNDFTVRDDFKYIQNDYWYLDSSDVEQHNYLGKRRTEHEQAHYDNTLTGLWRTQLTSMTALEIRGYWLTIRYEDEELAATEDEDKYVAVANLSRAYNARFSYGVFGKYEAWDESGKSWNRGQSGPEDLPRGIETYTIGLSAIYRTSARFRINAKYGWEWVDYEADSIDDRDFPGDGDISATYAFSLRTRGTIGFRYGVTESWVYPYASQDLYSLYSLFTFRHTQRLSSSIRFDYKISEYDLKYVPERALSEAYLKAHDGEKKDLYAEIGLNYRWTSNLNLLFTYSYEDVDSEVSTSYHENTFGIRAICLF